MRILIKAKPIFEDYYIFGYYLVIRKERLNSEDLMTYLTDIHYILPLHSRSEQCIIEIDPLTLSQNTNIKDANDEYIYENDICEALYGEQSSKDFIKIKGKIKYDLSSFYIEFKDDNLHKICTLKDFTKGSMFYYIKGNLTENDKFCQITDLKILK